MRSMRSVCPGVSCGGNCGSADQSASSLCQAQQAGFELSCKIADDGFCSAAHGHRPADYWQPRAYRRNRDAVRLAQLRQYCVDPLAHAFDPPASGSASQAVSKYAIGDSTTGLRGRPRLPVGALLLKVKLLSAHPQTVSTHTRSQRVRSALRGTITQSPRTSKTCSRHSCLSTPSNVTPARKINSSAV